MTAQILASELGNLIQESKRKHNELRTAAEKSLEELKSLRATSEAQIAADLTQRPSFITPFLVACSTKNVKFTGIAIVCLQRLVVSKALPRARLREVLEAFRDGTSAGLDVQLKILQALPSLFQNYATELKGELLVAALDICMVLQASKNGIVNNTAAATLQQLVVSIFDKVVAEDQIALEIPTVGEAPAEDGNVQVRSAALDAYRVFNDLCLLTESHKPKFLKSASIPQAFGLELIESVLTNHANLFLEHPEQAYVLRTRVMPFIISSLSEKTTFAVTVRIVRILYTLLRRHLSILANEGEMALTLLMHMLDHDTALWKRSLCMEVLRGIFSEASLIRRIFSMYDAQENRKGVLRDLVAAFVKISTEKPSVIGLGHQSSVPVSAQNNLSGSDQAMLEAGGVAGIISGTSATNEPSTGISTQWSTMRVPCIDQLDKTDPPPIPESYIYGLVLACISGFAEGLAKFILPLTVPDRRSKKIKPAGEDPSNPRAGLQRRTSIKKNPVLVNPLMLEEHPLHDEIQMCAGIVDSCWPAILATCSTFLYASLDTEYYHGLLRSFQKFTHVAGLLRLVTPRDAFLTTLGKAAVPANLMTASASITPASATPSVEHSSVFSNAKGLLSVDSLVGQTSNGDRARQASVDGGQPSLNTRNLLCLRALLNLGIALGSTLGSAWVIILGTLQQADLVLFSIARSAPRPSSSSGRQDSQQTSDDNALLANFGTEIKSVETAASRLLESTIDFPDDAFLEVVSALGALLGKEEQVAQTDVPAEPKPLSQQQRRPSAHRRLQSIHTAPATVNQEDLFVLAKLGEVASINIERLLVSSPEKSGWAEISTRFTEVACSTVRASSVRLRASEILNRLVFEAANVALALPSQIHHPVQHMIFTTLQKAVTPLFDSQRSTSVATIATDNDVHKVILDGLRSVLEQCGEALVTGWDIAFEVIDSVFVSTDTSGQADTQQSISPRSPRLLRPAFGSLQLICSDFLASLPNSCLIMLVDTLFKFSTQDDDLNVSLTTITFFWVLSDFISGRNSSFTLTSELLKATDRRALIDIASSDNASASDPALWMLLLQRLTNVTADDRIELRNSAIQTLLRIFDAFGDHLSAEGWSLCLQTIIFRLLASSKEQLEYANDIENDVSAKEREEWNETVILTLNGTSKLLAEYLQVISKDSSFEDSWENLLKLYEELLLLGVADISTATLKSLQSILSVANREDTMTLTDASINDAWQLWSKSLPKVKEPENYTKSDNQKYLLSYVSTLQEVYRLTQHNITATQIDTLLAALQTTVRKANAGTYSSDVENLTPLQTQILETFKNIRTDIEGVPAAIITQVSQIIELAFEDCDDQSRQKPTYIAISKAFMSLSETFILSHHLDHSIYNSGAVSALLQALAKPVVLKYGFKTVTKSTSPWQQATSSTLVILRSILPILTQEKIEEEVTKEIWVSVVKISNGITTAHFSDLPKSVDIGSDEEFDITSFNRMQDLIIPELGAPAIPDKTRRYFTESLFHQSLIHTPWRSELPRVDQELLANLYKIRRGRTDRLVPTQRKEMSYTCLTALFSLVCLQSSTPAQVKLAQAAAPYLILRAGLSLQMYIADQPLRGKMPQPLSQRNELLWILRKLVDLKCEPDAIPDAPGVDSENKKHLHRLYPLIAKAVRVASMDSVMLEVLGKALDEVGMEFGIGT